MTDDQRAADNAADVARAAADTARAHLHSGDTSAAEAQLLDALQHITEAIEALGRLSIKVDVSERD